MTVNVEVDSIICSIFEQFVDNWGNSNSPFKDNQGAVFSVRIDHDNYGYDKHGNHNSDWENHSNIFCHFIILASRCVFYAMEFEKDGRSVMDWKLIPLDKWKNTSNHSSCWRTDGFSDMNQDDYQAYERANGNVPEENRPSYNETHKFNLLGHSLGTGDIMKFVEVQHSPSENRNDHRRVINSIRELKVRMIIED